MRAPSMPERIHRLWVEVVAADAEAGHAEEDPYLLGLRNGRADGLRRGYCIVAQISDRAARDRILTERQRRG